MSFNIADAATHKLQPLLSVLVPFSAVATLTQLTQLAIHDITTSTAASKLKWIPAQLQALHMSLSRIRKCETLPSLKLGHLSKLTELRSNSKPLVIQQGDVLPPSLVVLRVRDCWASAPLLSLTRLQVGGSLFFVFRVYG
jgi:hypothetical protein